jgi:hypothetical protein
MKNDIMFLVALLAFSIAVGWVVIHCVEKYFHRPWRDDMRRRRIELEARTQRLIDRQRRKP